MPVQEYVADFTNASIELHAVKLLTAQIAQTAAHLCSLYVFLCMHFHITRSSMQWWDQHSLIVHEFRNCQLVTYISEGAGGTHLVVESKWNGNRKDRDEKWVLNL